MMMMMSRFVERINGIMNSPQAHLCAYTNNTQIEHQQHWHYLFYFLFIYYRKLCTAYLGINIALYKVSLQCLRDSFTLISTLLITTVVVAAINPTDTRASDRTTVT